MSKQLVVFLLFSFAASAQFGGGVLRVEVRGDGVASLRDLTVELIDCAGSHIGSALATDNVFEFHDVPNGCKLVQVRRVADGAVLQEERILHDGGLEMVTIQLAKIERSNAPAGTVSAERLRHPVPAKVWRGITEAQKLEHEGRRDDAAAKLREIVNQYPDVWEAELNLGILEMRQGHVEEGLTRFLRVRELNPKSVVAAANSGVALIRLHRLAEAERAVTEAIRLDPSNEIAHKLLDFIRSSNVE